MKSYRIILLVIAWILVFVSAGIALLLIGKGNYSMLNLTLVSLVVILGSVYLYREIKKTIQEGEGLPKEDELSHLIKYKTGYRAYMGSMYMWLFIFLFKDKFPTTESLIGGGILLSALIYFVLRNIEKRRFVE